MEWCWWISAGGTVLMELDWWNGVGETNLVDCVG